MTVVKLVVWEQHRDMQVNKGHKIKQMLNFSCLWCR